MVADTGTTPENTTLTVNAGNGILANDTDVDSSDTHTVSEVNGVAANIGADIAGSSGGTFTIASDGSYTFNPGTAFNDLFQGESRTTSVNYTDLDSNGLSASSTLTITVTGTKAIPATTLPEYPAPPVKPPIGSPSPIADPPVVIIPKPYTFTDPVFTPFDRLLQLTDKDAFFSPDYLGTSTDNGVVSYGDGATDNNSEYGLYLIKTPSSQEVLVEEIASFNLPTGTFHHSSSSARVTLEASLADGRPLPEWLSFDPDSGRFSGKPPKGTGGTMDIKVMARDDRGNVAFTQFLLHITELDSNDAHTLKERQTDSNAEWIDSDRQKPTDRDKDKPQQLKTKYAAYGRSSLSDQFMHQQVRGRNENLMEALRRATVRLQ